MPKIIRVRPGEKVTIFRRNFSSVPIDFHFHASALDGGQPDGEVEIQGSDWIFPKKPTTQPLQKHNVVHAGFWDTFFSVSVIAHGEVEISTPKRSSNLTRWIVWPVIIVMVIVVVTFLLAQ